MALISLNIETFSTDEHDIIIITVIIFILWVFILCISQTGLPTVKIPKLTFEFQSERVYLSSNKIVVCITYNLLYETAHCPYEEKNRSHL